MSELSKQTLHMLEREIADASEMPEYYKPFGNPVVPTHVAERWISMVKSDLQSQLQAAQAKLDLLRDPIEAIKAAGYENIPHFIIESLIDTFKQSGAENFLTQEFVDESNNESYQFTIGKVKGESTAAQLDRLTSELKQAQARIKELEKLNLTFAKNEQRLYQLKTLFVYCQNSNSPKQYQEDINNLLGYGYSLLPPQPKGE